MMSEAADGSNSATLLQMCLRTVAQNVDVLESRVCDLPTSLLKDLMPHLNIIDLDRIEKVASLKGVSSSFVWAAKWRDLNGAWRWKLKFMQPDEDWKQKCLESLFHIVLFKRPLRQKCQSNLSDYEVLSLSAKYVRVLSVLTAARDVSRLASEEMRPVLSTLEKGVKSIKVLDARALIIQGHRKVLFVLHRLLDHGCVQEVVLRRTPDCSPFRWITSRCRGIYSVDSYSSRTGDSPHEEGLLEWEGPSAPKCPRLEPYEDEQVCSQFSPSCSVHRRCPEGQIHTLDLEVQSLATVSHLLPSWLCLRSLHLYATQMYGEMIWQKEVPNLVESLRRLFLNPHCSLRDLSISNFCGRGLWTRLLTACPTLRSLSLEITPFRNSTWTPGLHFTQNTKLSLDKLSLISTDTQFTVDNFPNVLQLTPKLRSLHVAGIHHAGLLRSLPEFTPLLKVLTLVDINLADCHEQIIRLLENSKLEELTLKDCRLLEKCREKKDFLVSFVAAARKLDSLQSLSLSQNRLATNIIEIADLFLGDPPSKIRTLNLSSNFILPADLLEFSKRLETYRPAQRLMLDLQLNPFDRDVELKDEALRKLLPFCNIRTDDWDSRSTMADHVSVM